MDTKSCDVFLRFVKERNVVELNKFKNVPARMIIYCLKNDLINLQFFFKWLTSWCKYLPGAGSYHFTDIANNETFDIYKKYGFEPCNLYDVITGERWDYVLKVGYVTQEQYESRCA